MTVVDDLVKAVYLLPDEEDRSSVILSILRSAGGDLEGRFVAARKMLVDTGASPRDALTEALNLVIRGPDGEKILRVIGSAAAIEAANTGIIDKQQVAGVSKQYADTLIGSEAGAKPGELGFIGTIIAAAAAIGTLATKGIAAAVHKARSRRRRLKARMTPLDTEEALVIAQATAPRYATFEEAQGAILDMIAEKRYGRHGWLLDPASGASRGSVINEYRDVKRVWLQVREQINANIRAAQQKKQRIVGLAAVVGGVIVIGAVAYVLK
jgi:hypothetical protein